MSKRKLLNKIKYSWRKIFSNLNHLGNISSHNQIKIFSEADGVFLDIFLEIDKATSYVIIETYTLANDSLGIMLKEHLLTALKRGVKIHLTYDYVGSAFLPGVFFKELKDNGALVKAFNPLWPFRGFAPFYFRNHRKLVIIDDKIAYLGGMNFTKDYTEKPLGTGRFRDTMAKIKGPSVFDIKNLCQENIQFFKYNISHKWAKWFFLGRYRAKVFLKSAFKKKGIVAQILESNKKKNLRHIQLAMELCINKAVEYCYFTTPYFLPYKKLKNALVDAAKRGVEVKILTAGLSDVPLMLLASHHIYENLLKNGVSIYEMQKKTLHAKTASIDGFYGTVGSYNLDHWSNTRNLEINLSFFDRDLSLKLKEDFLIDLKDAKEVSKEGFLKRSIWRKILSYCAYKLMRI